MVAADSPRRHALAWIAPSARRETVRAAQAFTRATLAEWLALDRPLTVRRPHVGETVAHDAIALGLPLPPPQGKQRISLIAPRAALARLRDPLSVSEAASNLQGRWQAVVLQVDALARHNAVTFRVYGGAAWQALTRLNYLTASSDLDLLAEPTGPGQLAFALSCFAAVERTASMDIDGEIVFPGGNAVAWREWRAGAGRVLVKRIDGVSLQPREALLAQFATADRPPPQGDAPRR
jgi:phosphoribosyl-dephospho-CoA transferase